MDELDLVRRTEGHLAQGASKDSKVLQLAA